MPGRPTFRSPLERLLWLAACGVALGIYGSAYFVQFLLDALRAHGLLGPTVWTGLGLAAVVALAFVVRERPGVAETSLLVAAGAAYLVLVWRLDIVQERIHLIEYGLVGGFVYEALRERWSRPASARVPQPRWQRWPAVVAVLVATLIGWGDELVQGLLPNRVYDLRDVLTNAEAAALLVVVLAARHALRPAPLAAPESIVE
jgi:hypothetical protein